jgi:glyoxylase-like metal-dependent hydrolase (beta-lactamase superfamily II)
VKGVAGQPDRAAEFEIHFLPVGSESKGGDAIALRYGNLTGSNPHQRVVVVDGGYATDGRVLAQQIGQYFHTSRVDLVISTHPDHDHSAGLVGVLEELSVDMLLMHLPANHPIELAVAKAEAPQGSPLSERLEKSLAGSDRLQAIARSKGIPIVEPFTGFQSDDGALQPGFRSSDDGLKQKGPMGCGKEGRRQAGV